MQKKILRRGTLQLPCNQAKPGAALSSWGINMPTFCREFNAKTSDQEAGKIVTVKIEVFEDKSYNFEVKGTATSILLKNFLKGEKVISSASVDEIAQIKMKDLNTDSLEKARKTVLGSIKSAGIRVEN
ncbi:MAG: 50S ribosomal protein L11 [Mycoplasmataceae bacterium]|nr:MAG: 50S ribosomal protein L11 [Mycoplasmataceae bacterium]